MSLIRNERAKLLASSIDRMSTTCLTVGVAAPFAGYLYGLNRLAGWHWIAATIGWLLAALALHIAANRALGRMQE